MDSEVKVVIKQKSFFLWISWCGMFALVVNMTDIEAM
jgi:hypothetical protein